MDELKPLVRATRIIMAMRKELAIGENEYEELLECFVDQENLENQIRKEEREVWQTIINSVISACNNPEEIGGLFKEAIRNQGEK